MKREDIDQVLDIEEASFVRPWTRSGFEAELEKDFGLALVAESGDRVVGYGICWMIGDEIHIANLAVHPDWRRRTVGRSLLKFMLDKRTGMRIAALEVRRSNLDARKLYGDFGFNEIGVRKRYYIEENEDAIVMQKQLAEHATRSVP
jgi:[ribosomal protein S18]-alanine N-acetyltransferase